MVLEIIPIKIQREIGIDANFVDLILESSEINDGDILVFSQKIVSKNEGRILSLSSVNPSLLADGIASSYGKDPRLVELILSESERIVRMENGIIIVKTGKSYWTALVEAKVGNSELNVDQIERYLDLAKLQGIDAVITISNQYANIPSHHPIKVNGQKTRSVNLYHWSWKSLLTEAVLHTDENKDHKDITDETQLFILQEFKRFLQHESTGLNTITQMNKSWSAICAEGGLEKKDDDSTNAVASWHNLCRELSLDLSEKTGTNVSPVITRKYLQDKNGYSSMLKDDVKQLHDTGTVTASFKIEDAASNLEFTANVKEKYITSMMMLRAPKDAKTARGAIGWLSKQLGSVEINNVHVMAKYAGRNTNKTATLNDLLEQGYEALNDDNKNIPLSFEVYTKHNLKLSDIKGVKKFVEIARNCVFEYYKNIGQNLKVAPTKAPKMTNKEKKTEDLESELVEG